jgi:hypothetical protein
MTKYLILILLVAGCACLGLPTKPTIPFIPTPIEQLWNAAKQSNWLVAVSILGIAAGVFALMNGNKLGVPAAVASCASLFMSLAVARFAAWMAICGLIGSVLICVISILFKNRGLVELVNGAQALKNYNANDSKQFTKMLKECQTKSTQRIVQKIKSRMKVKEI